MDARNETGASPLQMTYAETTGALYLRLRDGEVAETVHIDAEGVPLGIEFVAASDLTEFLQRQGGAWAVPARLSVPAGAG